jgi:putative sterol carrier protein
MFAMEHPLASVEELTDRIRRAIAAGADLDRSVKLDLKGEGVIRIAGGAVSNEDGPADLTVTVSARDLAALGRRELDPTRAMMTGRLRLSDMALAMSLQPQIQALFAKAAGA